MKKSTMIAYLVIGGGAYYLYDKRKKAQAATAQAAAAAAAAAAAQAAASASAAAPISEFPTDSMMPGAMPAAVQGIIKDTGRQVQNQAMLGMGYFGAMKKPMRTAVQRAASQAGYAANKAMHAAMSFGQKSALQAAKAKRMSVRKVG